MAKHPKEEQVLLALPVASLCRLHRAAFTSTPPMQADLEQSSLQELPIRCRIYLSSIPLRFVDAFRAALVLLLKYLESSVNGRFGFSPLILDYGRNDHLRRLPVPLVVIHWLPCLADFLSSCCFR